MAVFTSISVVLLALSSSAFAADSLRVEQSQLQKPMPSSINDTRSSRQLPGDQFARGDQTLPGDHFLPEDGDPLNGSTIRRR